MSVAEKKPSIPLCLGNVVKCAPFSISNPYFSQNLMTCMRFSSGSTEHVQYTILPVRGLTKCKLSYNMTSCTLVISWRRSRLNFQRKSGFRRITPVPVHGTSSMTQSHFLCKVSFNWDLSWCTWQFWTPARFSRYFVYTRMLFLMSCRNIYPLLCIKGAKASVLPPEPPQ